MDLKNEEIKGFAKDHDDFINGALDIISRGRIPKHSHKAVIENLATAHGFTSFFWPDSNEPFFIRKANLDRFKSLIEKAVANKNIDA